MFRVSFFGAAQEVTGSCYLIEDNETKFLIDCGMFQCPGFCNERTREDFPFDPHSLAAAVVSHAHIDHSGRVPKLVNSGFSGPIYSSVPTRDLAELMLKDSVGVLTKEARNRNEPLLYTEEDVDRAMSQWEHIEYGAPFHIGAFEIILYRAGHILGSSMVFIRHSSRSVLFTGDLGNPDNPLLTREDTLPPFQVLAIDATYGDRVHEGVVERKLKLERAIEQSVMRGGVLMIPAFSLERTQEIIWEIAGMLKKKQIPHIPIFIDSPLAIAATAIYQKYYRYLRRAAEEEKSFSFLKSPSVHFTRTTEESKRINDIPSPKIIIAGSGMSTGGRILHHERRYLSDPQSTILFMGYQAPGSLGRMIQDGADTVTIMRETVLVRCHREVINGYSAHVDQEDIMDFVREHSDTLQRVIAVHGEPKAALAIVQKIRDYLAIDAIAPKYGESVDI
ncbi:MAG TPA: MBL fold metallo-hydrolase [Candidatus Paceibacterota bacterium]